MANRPTAAPEAHARRGGGSRGGAARRQITESAVRFLWDHAVRDLTVARLMEGTTLSRSAFYQYFADIPALIESLLGEVETVMHAVANPWIEGVGEPIPALRESLRSIVTICVEHGPIVRAISEAAPFDKRLERTWEAFMGRWDDAVTMRIEAQQEAGLVAAHDAHALARALNRSDAATLITEFGRRPQGDPEAVLNTLHRVWVGALYGHD